MKRRRTACCKKTRITGRGTRLLCLALPVIFLTACGMQPVQIRKCAPDRTLIQILEIPGEATTNGALLDQNMVMKSAIEEDNTLKELLRKQVDRCYKEN